jgi:hypothetical protein
MSSVCVVVRRWQPRRSREHIIEVPEQGRHGERRHRGPARWHTLPDHVMIVVPAAHASMGKILEDGVECAKPMDTKNHLVAYQGNDKKIQHEFLTGNAKFDVLADAGAADLVTVCHNHLAS